MSLKNSVICLGVLIFSGIFFAKAQSSITLNNAIATAKSNNLFLKTAAYQTTIAETDLISAQLRPNPVLNNQSLMLLKPSLFPEGTSWLNRRNTQIWWQLTKTIQLPAQRKYKIDLANQQIVLERNRYKEIEQNLSLNVANAWINVWILANQVDLITQAKSNVDTLVRINENRLKNQVINQNDFIRTQLLSQQYVLHINSLKQEYYNALQTLKLQIGVMDSIIVKSTDSVRLIPFRLQPDSLLQQALFNRSDIQTARSNIEFSQVNINLQKAMAYPMPDLGVIWNPQNSVPYLGFFGTIELPFFNRNQGERQKSKILHSQAQQNLQAIQFQVSNEVITAYRTFQTRQQNMELFQKVLLQSAQVLNTVRYSYLRGGTTIIDYLEAQRSWFETRQQFYDAQLSFYQSYFQLLFVTGLISQL
jgi:cobalt-zinc-cadmium efflux system outer membrane protein